MFLFILCHSLFYHFLFFSHLLYSFFSFAILSSHYFSFFFFFFSSRRRHTRCSRDWSSDVCSSDLVGFLAAIWIRRRSTEGSSDAFAWPMAASLLCAPVVYPWYLLWLLPFMR